MMDEEEGIQELQEDEGEEETQESAFKSASVKPKQIQMTDEELKAIQKEVMEYKDKYLRQLAESENSRKRLQKERQDLILYATEKLIVDFLRPLDNFENALRFAQDMSDEVKNWAFGFQMILAQFKDVLSQNGVTSIDSVGKAFNPHDHEAIEVLESIDYPPGTVLEESVRGYRMGDRTIRAARVKVAKMKDASTQE